MVMELDERFGKCLGYEGTTPWMAYGMKRI